MTKEAHSKLFQHPAEKGTLNMARISILHHVTFQRCISGVKINFLKGVSWKTLINCLVLLAFFSGLPVFITASYAGVNDDLLAAVEKGDLSEVRKLLNSGADVNAKRKDYGSSALIVAATVGHVDIVKLLLEKGADVNAKDGGEKGRGNSALTQASISNHVEIVKILLDKGADVNSSNKFGDTAIMGAAAAGNADVIKVLLTKKVHINAKNNYGWSALMMAQKKGHTAIVNMLKQAGAS